MNKFTIDCKAISDRGDMHDTLASALGFPGWYGKNLDALADMLTSIGEETLIELTAWSSLGSFAAGFGEVFADCARANPNLKIFFN